jgi:putative transcriptional regulator
MWKEIMVVNRLPFILRQKGLSIRELSRLTGITYTTIRAVYHGDRRSVQIEVMDSLCRVMDLQPGDIYKYYPDESAAQSAEDEILAHLEHFENQQETGSTNGSTSRPRDDSRNQSWHVW